MSEQDAIKELLRIFKKNDEDEIERILENCNHQLTDKCLEIIRIQRQTLKTVTDLVNADAPNYQIIPELSYVDYETNRIAEEILK